MARSWSTDYLQQFTFWLVDVAPIGAFALPIFNPFMGFSSITAPEITLTTETVSEANWIFDKKVVTGASVGPMTLQRGVTWFDSDFWHWVMATLKGDPEEFKAGYVPALRTGGVTPRRTMMLVHFFTRMTASPFVKGPQAASSSRSRLTGVGATIAGGAAQGIGAAATLGAVGGMMNAAGFPPFEFAPRIPAKVYMLYGCTPSRLKLDGDFDASSGDVSIAEMDIDVEMIEQKTFEF